MPLFDHFQQMQAQHAMTTAMGTATQAIGTINKQMGTKQVMQTLQQFQKESMHMEMAEEALDDAFADEEVDQESDVIVDRVMAEIGLEQQTAVRSWCENSC